MRNRRAVCWLVVAFSALTAPGRSPAAERSGSPLPLQPRSMRTMVDMDGRSVRIPPPDAIRRVAVLTSPQVQIAYIMGCQDRLCAVTNAAQRWSLLHELDPRLRTVPAVRAGAGQVNLEALLETNPDLSMGSATDLATVEASTPIPTLHVATPVAGNMLAQIEKDVAFFGEVFGRPERAHAYSVFALEVQKRIAALVEKRSHAPQPRVFMGFGPDHLITYGGDTFMQELIARAGCQNAASSLRSFGGKEGGLATVSLEHILTWSPDWLVVDDGDPATLRKDPAWSAVTAVRSGHVVRLPVGVFIWNRPSAESAVMLPLWLASQVDPVALPPDELAASAERFYRDVFGLPVTLPVVERILRAP